MANPLLLLATPLFGLALQLDPNFALPSGALSQLEAQIEMESRQEAATDAPISETRALEPSQRSGAEAEMAADTATDSSEPSLAVTTSLPLAEEGFDAEEQAAPRAGPVAPRPNNDIAALMSRRGRIGRAHKWLGIGTWTSMTAATILGTIQYRNLYGFFASRDDTPCVRGDAIGGANACVGVPVPHLVTAAIAGSAYISTFALSFAMPDPIGLDQGNSRPARQLRTHKRLRWAHLSTMVAQILLGVVISNGSAFGLDRTNDFRTIQALSTVHLLSGYATYGLLTWSGALMIRR